MGFGLSFGANSTNSTTNSSGTKIEDGTQTGSQTTGSTQVGTQNQQQTSQSNSAGSSNTSQQTSSAETGTTKQQQQQTTSLFSNPVLGGLEGLVTKLLSGGAPANPAMDYLGNFDPKAYINSTLQAAKATSDTGLQQTIGGLIDAIGGKHNSQVALLSQQATNTAAANLAGVNAQATQTAQGIEQGAAQTVAASQAQKDSFTAQLLDALKGGTQSTSGSAATTTAQQGTESQTGQTNTAEQNNTSSQSTEQTLQTLTQLISSLLSSHNITTANETSNTKGSTVGGGMSLSL